MAGIEDLQGLQLAVSCMKCIVLRNEAIKNLGSYFSCNTTIREETNFLKVVTNMQTVLKLSRFRNLSFERRMIVFKSLAISKNSFWSSDSKSSKLNY